MAERPAECALATNNSFILDAKPRALLQRRFSLIAIQAVIACSCASHATMNSERVLSELERTIDNSQNGIAGCPAPSGHTSKDKDLARAVANVALEAGELCAEETEFPVDGGILAITKIWKPGEFGDSIFIVLHDEEDDAFDSMLWAVSRFGGLGIALENDEDRKFSGRDDPNRIFGKTGFEDYTARVSELIRPYSRVVAIHTNKDGPGTTMSSLRSSGVCDAGDDPDNFISLGEIGPPYMLTCMDERLRRFAGRGLNVIYSQFSKSKVDAADCLLNGCRLQPYATEMLKKEYFNIEAERRKGTTVHSKQLCAIMSPDTAEEACLAAELTQQ